LAYPNSHKEVRDRKPVCLVEKFAGI